MAHKIKATFHWNGEEDLLKRANLEKGGLVQKVIDKAVMDWCVQYCPFDTGNLATSPYSNSVIGSGEVVYDGPYARYLYYGNVMGPNIPIFDDNSGEPSGFFSPPNQKKHLTGKRLTYSTDKNPLAGPFWDRRMAADHMDDIIKEAKNAAGIK